MRYYPVVKRRFKKDQIILSEDSQGDGMYIIESGKVRVYKTIGGAKKNEIELCTLGPKAMFGEMAIIDDNPRSASVQAVAPTVCMVITRKTFEEQLDQIPPWMVSMIRVLVKRLRETNDKLRKIIEQYVSQAPEDTGRVLTIDKGLSSVLGGDTDTLFR